MPRTATRRIEQYAVMDMGPMSKTIIRHLRPGHTARLAVNFPDGKGGATGVELQVNQRGDWSVTTQGPDYVRREVARGTVPKPPISLNR